MIADAAVTCFKKGEYTSGFNKICIYTHETDVVITLASNKTLPIIYSKINLFRFTKFGTPATEHS